MSVSALLRRTPQLRTSSRGDREAVVSKDGRGRDRGYMVRDGATRLLTMRVSLLLRRDLARRSVTDFQN
jgi:hypothetical protein